MAVGVSHFQFSDTKSGMASILLFQIPGIFPVIPSCSFCLAPPDPFLSISTVFYSKLCVKLTPLNAYLLFFGSKKFLKTQAHPSRK